MSTDADSWGFSVEILLKFGYTKRWLIEVDFRFIKTVLQMDVLRCKTHDLVCKEIWVHLLAYNLIRTVMAQAAHRYDASPRTPKFPRHVTAVKCI
jgi:IS4 transposase